ncbi:MAG: phage baseplate assembly protein V [Ignavibacteria bacterium]
MQRILTRIIFPQKTVRLPAVQGLETGIVTDLEDPEGENRVKVKLPVVSSSEDGIWMRIATLDAGSNRSTFPAGNR